MPKHDHVPSRPTLPSEVLSRGRAPPFTGLAKRKVSAGSELTSEAGKRARGSDLDSLTSVLEAAEPEAAAIPRTPRNKSFVEGPATPTLTARFASTTVDDKEPSTPPPSTTPPKSTPDARDTVFCASAVTPHNMSSSHVDPSCVNPSDSRSQRHRLANAPKKFTRSQCSKQTIESNKTTKVLEPEMEELLKYELCGRVFQHNKFYDEFLPVNREIQTQARNIIEASGDIKPGSYLGVDQNNTWTIHEEISLQTDELEVYDKLASMLNVVGRGAHPIYQARNKGEQFRQKYHPFLDHHNRVALWDSPSDTATSPDLVMSDGQARAHWGDMELIIECKSSSSTNHRNEAYVQLARYARAVFAHQIYRLHVFGFSLCGSIVNFVRFDRSGLLHSPDIDLSTPGGAHSFVQHVITLLTIKPDKFGYDIRYSFKPSDDETKIDTLFKFPGLDDPQVVSELICYRKCCCGRATCVCALGDDVHKGIWRPEDRDDEGETLALFKGVFGVCQVKAFDYERYTTRLEYPEDLVESPSAYFFYPNPDKPSTAHISGPSKSSTHSKTASQASAPGEPHNSDQDVVRGPMPATSILRGVRVKSDILMPRGASLFDAQSPLHLVMAINDALLGIMALTEAGKIHCDISAYNLLLVDPKKHYGNNGWDKSPKVHPAADVWNITGDGTIHIPTDGDMNPSQSAAFRLQFINKLERGPVCVVHDTEFTVDEHRTRDKVHSDRTLLDGYMSASGPTKRTFMHDVESLLWILVWVVAHRSQDKKTWKINDTAKRLIRKLSQNNYESLASDKEMLLTNRSKLVSNIRNLKNDWSDDLIPIIKDLADILYLYLYVGNTSTGPVEDEDSDSDFFNPPNPMKQVKGSSDEKIHRAYMAEPRINTFVHLLRIFRKRTRALQVKYPSVDLDLL
ncbi:hypothetical protein FRC07_009909 [Ceratobasidium sp. 392]|nr:hypothetical protein FRC07_009909 [Ceratobasidium sp. 392]